MPTLDHPPPVTTSQTIPSMSSKRGRKRNDSLPPNRARDVQRAFRARRAAHLLVNLFLLSSLLLPLIYLLVSQALEQRVAELEDENDAFRQALNLPPANRPALGKGPTGKDKPRNYDPSNYDHSPSSFSFAHGQSLSSSVPPSRTSSSASSTRTSSLSPSVVAASMPRPDLDPPNWDHALIMSDTPSAEGSPSAASSYQPLPPLSAPLSLAKPLHYPYSSNSIPTSRASLPNVLYTMPSSQPAFSAAGERVPDYPSQTYGMHDGSDDQQSHYSYSMPHYQCSSPVSFQPQNVNPQR
jgi:hypothetical protein